MSRRIRKMRTGMNGRALAMLILALGFGTLDHRAGSLVAQTWFYDAAGRLVRVAYSEGGGIRYDYDDADNMTSVARINLPAAPSDLTATRVSGSSVQLSWQDRSGIEQGYTVMRRLASNYQWQVIANLGSGATSYIDNALDPAADYVYRVAAVGSAGSSAYSEEAASSSSTSVQITTSDGGVAGISTPGLAADVRAGYAVVTVQFGTVPYGTAVFSLQQNGVVVSEAGVPASPPTQAARIFIDFRSGVAAGTGTIEINTGFAVVNRGSDLAHVTYTLRDLNGLTVASGSGTLELGAHYAKFINQIRDVAPNFNLPPDFSSNVQFGSLEFTSDQPLSILALRLTTNQRGDTLLTTTPIADLSRALSADPLYFPQLADGGGYKTSIVLLNTSGTSESGAIEVFGDGGSPLDVRFNAGPSASAFNYFIPPGGALVMETDGSPETTNPGWVRLTPNPGTAAPVGAGIFQYSPGGTLVTESGVPAAVPTTRARIYVDKSGGHDTGLAIANPAGTGLNLTFDAYQSDGTTTAGNGSGALGLGGMHHTARFVDQLVAGLPSDFVGVLDISGDQPFLAVTLRSLVNDRKDFLLTTFPIADATRPAPQPIIFPQIADGGGFITQFILLSPTGGSATAIDFFGSDGEPLPLFSTP